ncbi:disulfide bond formation protein B [Spiribacter salinus]|uniref:disulfide bond formation protein B n=1 Tax=Spiribacter salinus TaxID=1335746 RepID=UPI001C9866E2|nr:disulfide bond formation protein B [Spiribacter salinus]MBY5268915.1 disulfide bond formation protein DsbB [Spiribacter salinus]
MNFFNQWLNRSRPMNAALGGLCLGLVVIAVAIEVGLGMEPCPLCIFQRVAFVAMGVVLWLGVVIPGWTVGLLAGGAALAGIALAWRHLWLQSLPADEVPACGPGLDYLVDAFPLAEVVTMVLAGSGECAEVDRILGVSIPLWTLLAFAVLGLAAVVINGLAAVKGRS